MTTIVIRRGHNREPCELREIARTVASKLSQRIGGNYHWRGDSIHYKYPGVRARIDCGAEEVCVDIELGILMLPLRAGIEREVREALDQHLP